MSKEINIPVVCPNCGDTFNLKNLDSLAFVHTCTDEICEMKYLVVVDTKNMEAVTQLILTGDESQKHLKLLLDKRLSSAPVTQEQIDADNDRQRGYHRQPNGGNLWVAFDNSALECYVDGFETEKEAIEWLGYSMLADKRTSDVLEAIRAKERKERMWWKGGRTAAWAVMVTYTLYLLFSASQARADNAHDLKAFIDGSTSQQTPASKASTAIKKAANKPLDYLMVRDAVAGGAVEPSYTAIAFFAHTSPDETRRAIRALERDGVIIWNAKTSTWELSK